MVALTNANSWKSDYTAVLMSRVSVNPSDGCASSVNAAFCFILAAGEHAVLLQERCTC